jgi:DNA polymerase-1
MNGVKVDTDLLRTISDDLGKQLKKTEEQIHHLAGQKFNPSSPKQLADVLFDKLGLRVVRKTKTGRSTDSDVLEELAVDHPLPGLILDYRSLAKLRGTYTDALPKLINPKTGRIHTSFNQTVTSTGRLSSSDPNLQNIPVRTEAGRGIREAFVPEKGMLLVSADYNQIELRILAHLSRDETMLDSFRKKQDVHTRTAAEVFGVSQKDVTYEMRRRAKVVNFGIAYGMSAYGLSKQLRIPQREAQAIIDAYFARSARVRKYMDGNIECARRLGYVETLRGRRLFLPEINSKNRQVRLFAERAAINAPMQGTAADIIKQAMIEIHNWLHAKKSKTRMILQVHDELLFEVPENDVPQIEKMVQDKMQSVVEIEAPLTVDVSHGKNWAEAH